LHRDEDKKMNDRRQENLPCGHKFTFYEPQGKNNLIRCCTCDWKELILERSVRKTDLTYKEFIEVKKDWGEA
jgi:hypothetical protein